MRDIWSQVMDGVPRSFDRFRDLQQQFRKDALALLTPEQRAKYEDLEKHYRDQLARLDADREARFNQAVAKTKQILTPEQAAKYDDLISHRPGPGADAGPPGPPPRDEMLLIPAGPGPDGGPPHHRDDSAPAPASAPAP